MTHNTAIVLVFVAFNALAAGASAQTPTLVTTFDPALGELPESIAIDSDGTKYLSMGNTIRRLDAAGNSMLFGTLPIQGFALGVKVGPDGCVYNASTSLDPSIVGAFVWRTCVAGETEQFAALDPEGGPNDLAFDSAGNLYVTDPLLGRIYKIDEGGAWSILIEDALLLGNPASPALLFSPQGVNGIALDKNERNLYVGNLDYGRILRVELDDCGATPALSVFAESPLLRGADGLAFDQKQTLYVAVGAQDQLVAVDKHGTVTLVAQGGILNGPASVAFGTTSGEQKTLYVADLDFLRAFVYMDGTAAPNLVQLHTSHQGLPLP
jgi:sugar lactone lactonase YvrE